MYILRTVYVQRATLVTLLALLFFWRIDSVLANTKENTLVIDDRSSGNLNATIGSQWRFVTDDVMGGLSTGGVTLDTIEGKNCLRLRGDIRTDNNGGFIQIALPLSNITTEETPFDASAYTGVEIEVLGNNQNYNIHFRTDDLWFPWQSYRFSFDATPDWQTHRIPFTQLEPHMTTHDFSKNEIIQLGLLAIGSEFEANLCLASIKFYTE